MSEGLVFNMVGGGGGGGIKLTGITITTPPSKTTYTAGETFDPAGMVVQATYSNGATLQATGYAYSPSTALTDGTTKVTIVYTEGGVSATAEQEITVVHRLESIAITTQPSKTVYEYGDSFASAGMVVRATYSDGATANVTGYTYSPTALNTVGTQTITVSYTDRGITKTTTLSVTVERKSIATVPSQSGTLTYTGNAQSPSWSNYNSAQLTLGGVTSGTNAGSYNATFTPTANYRWSNGSTAAKTVAWSIGKAAGSLSISPTSMTLDMNNKTKTITVTRAGDGTISATSSNTAAATVSVSGTTVTVTGKASGSATITVSVAAGTNHNAPANKTCAVTVNFISTTLNDNDWATIRQVSDNGQGSNYWSIGDRKAVTLNGTVGKLSLSNVTTYAFIIGFNHNASVEGTNRIHFQLAKTALTGGTDVCLCDSSYGSSVSTAGYFSMNSSRTNSGGWARSQMRTNICGTSLSSYSGTIIAVIPAALRAVLKSVTKYTDNTANGGGSTASYVTATTDYFFLLSEFEVFRSISYGNTNEKNKQAQYAYYSAGNSKIKYKHNGTSTAAAWWLRSPYAGYSANFVIVDTDGTVASANAHYSLGFAPGFCV